MHEYMSEVQIWELTCPGHLEEVGRARRWTRDILSDSPQADDAALIVTELTTNALLHSNSGADRNSFNLTLARAPEWIAISVSDSGSTGAKPHIQRLSQSALHGRGLLLVAALTDRLEVRGDADGHVVTAVLLNQRPALPDVPTAPASPPSAHQLCQNSPNPKGMHKCME